MEIFETVGITVVAIILIIMIFRNQHNIAKHEEEFLQDIRNLQSENYKNLTTPQSDLQRMKVIGIIEEWMQKRDKAYGSGNYEELRAIIKDLSYDLSKRCDVNREAIKNVERNLGYSNDVVDAHAKRVNEIMEYFKIGYIIKKVSVEKEQQVIGKLPSSANCHSKKS